LTEHSVDSILDGFAHFGVELGLERIERLLARLGNPHQRIPIVHVAGSNGKGSVCAYLSAVLTRAGYRVGRYTSPHLVDWTERICISEVPITPEDLHRVVVQTVEAIAPNYSSPTQFEVITAAAWLYFAQQQVDLAVIEVGLGGRLDATNVCDRPLVSVITSLSLEHVQRLGPTLADIGREKAGILKPSCPAVIAPLPPEAAPVVNQRLMDLACPTVYPQPAEESGDDWVTYHSPLQQPTLTEPFKYQLPLPGAHQRLNSALAIATIELLRQQGWTISEEAIAQGIAHTTWPGRLQWLRWRGQPLLVDGAHNPAGAAALRHYLDHELRVTGPITWVMGLLSTKDPTEIFEALLRPGNRLILVPVPDHLTANPEELRAIAQTVCPQLADCRTGSDVIEGLTQVFTENPTDGLIVLCGSLYLIGHFFKIAKTDIQPVIQNSNSKIQNV
jgi:dihydrofolate synthase / folylpolyglutamate synthase